jgi:hypothetical protein
MAGWFGASPTVSPDRVRASASPDTPTPVATASAAESDEARLEAPQPEKKKRGFWSRVFGRGDRDEARKKSPPR